ncbi:hypothetical protein F1880_000719 [Penicillium rolfsii]|nr:hypothetical protein F1880_000719 [Penicillium rolfsii]
MTRTILKSPGAGIDDGLCNSQTLPQPNVQVAEPVERKKRTRTGCLNCSRRRRKCDEAKPTCTGCKRRGDECQWRLLGSFREANIKVLGSDHPSMSQGVITHKSKRPSKFKILNTLSNSPRTRGSSKRQAEASRTRSEAEPHASSPVTVPTLEAVSDAQSKGSSQNCGSSTEAHQGLATPLSPGEPAHLLQHHQSPASLRHRCSEETTDDLPSPGTSRSYHSTHQYEIQRDTATNNTSPHAYVNTNPEFLVDGLAAWRGFSHPTPFDASVTGSYHSGPSPLFANSVFSDPGDLTNDVFLPGSTYEALHTTLRNRQLWTARPDRPSRTSSRDSISHARTQTAYSDSGSFTRTEREPRTGRVFELSHEREHILWQNYLNEICSWLDMFDNNHHFASTFPQMAKTAPHLRYSCLALSARQLERQQNAKSQSESLSLYQEAIHLLLPELESKTTPVIASCVILCVLEMLSCNPKEWRRHLDGCAYLIQAAGINGFSGKEEQALFWCFARMDVCGGLISEEETIIPLHNWRPRDMTANEASQLFLSSARSGFDTYANCTVYLCAQTLGVLFGCSSHTAHPCSPTHCIPEEDINSYVYRWRELFGQVEQWFESRPSQMKSIFTVAQSGSSGIDQPFPMVLYGNGAAISGNQLYHVCALLLLQHKPKTLSLSKKPKSVLWHARQICAISASNTHHGCWTNALQPLWIAGKVMSHYSEHTAIVDTLIRIERETGWATAWRVEDLKDFWGDYDNDDECDVDMDGMT